VLRIRIRDPGLGAFLTPGSGIRDGRKSASGSGIRDEQPGSLFLELRNHFFAFLGVKILKFFDEDPGSGIWDPGWRQFGSGIRNPGWKKVRSGIRDKHPGSATLPATIFNTSRWDGVDGVPVPLIPLPPSFPLFDTNI
jgi:hypothetical protein